MGTTRERTSTARTLATWVLPLLALVGFRSAVAAPFHVPSGSMAPTIEIRDMILVSKLSYGLNVPWLRFDGSPGLGVLTTREVVSWADPQRGDVILFRYPPDPSQDFIKRVIGVPGDRVAVKKGEVWINGEAVERTEGGSYVFEDPSCGRSPTLRYVEDIDGVKVDVLRDLARPARSFDEVIVPEDRLFVMGDNREHSADSRMWGWVPRAHVRGRAQGIWMRHGCDGKVSVHWRSL